MSNTLFGKLKSKAIMPILNLIWTGSECVSPSNYHCIIVTTRSKLPLSWFRRSFWLMAATTTTTTGRSSCKKPMI